MPKFDIEKNRKMTKAHLEKITADAADPAVRNKLLDGLAEDAFETEIGQSEELGPEWPAESREVDDIRKARMRGCTQGHRLYA